MATRPKSLKGQFQDAGSVVEPYRGEGGCSFENLMKSGRSEPGGSILGRENTRKEKEKEQLLCHPAQRRDRTQGLSGELAAVYFEEFFSLV